MNHHHARCNVHWDELRSGAFDTPVVCQHCSARIPPSAALTFDGTDYVWHFCGHECLADWCARTGRLQH